MNKWIVMSDNLTAYRGSSCITKFTWSVRVCSMEWGSQGVGYIHWIIGWYDRPLNPLKAGFEESLAPGIDLWSNLGYSWHGQRNRRPAALGHNCLLLPIQQTPTHARQSWITTPPERSRRCSVHIMVAFVCVCVSLAKVREKISEIAADLLLLLQLNDFQNFKMAEVWIDSRERGKSEDRERLFKDANEWRVI